MLHEQWLALLILIGSTVGWLVSGFVLGSIALLLKAAF